MHSNNDCWPNRPLLLSLHFSCTNSAKINGPIRVLFIQYIYENIIFYIFIIFIYKVSYCICTNLPEVPAMIAQIRVRDSKHAPKEAMISVGLSHSSQPSSLSFYHLLVHKIHTFNIARLQLDALDFLPPQSHSCFSPNSLTSAAENRCKQAYTLH